MRCSMEKLKCERCPDITATHTFLQATFQLISTVSKQTGNASKDLDSSISDSSIRWHYADEMVTFSIEIFLQREV